MLVQDWKVIKGDNPVVVTCPHCCNVSEDENCDFLSGKVAKRIQENLSGSGFYRKSERKPTNSFVG